jgi:import inner membrane translocase subunit TIM17
MNFLINVIVFFYFYDAIIRLSERFPSFTNLVFNSCCHLTGQFAVWGGLFAASDCTISHLRGKEDWKNSVMAGAVTSGMLAIRGMK